MKPECRGWFGRRWCKFEARYDVVNTVDFMNGIFSTLKYEGPPEKCPDMRPRRTYVRDVCVRCGDTRERPKDAQV